MSTSATINTEMFKAMCPFLYLYKYLGLQPLTWEKIDSFYVIAKSSNYIFYGCFLNMIILLTGIYGLANAFEIETIHSIRSGTNAKRYVNYTDVTVALSTSSIGIIIISLNINKIVTYFDHLSKFDRLVKKRPQNLRKLYIVTYVTLIFTVTLFVADLIHWMKIGHTDQSYLVLFGYFLPFYVAYFILILLELLYLKLVYFIKIRLSILINKLLEFKKDSVFRNVSCVARKVANLESTNVQQIYDLADAYDNLYEAAVLVNDCYGFLILVVLFGCFTHLLVTPYDLHSTLTNYAWEREMIGFQCSWLICHVFRLILIVEPCHGCSSEARRVSAVVCKLLHSEVQDDVKISLHFFLICLSQCKIEFTAFGLLTIRRSLLTTITGAVTTYLVILVQFQ